MSEAQHPLHALPQGHRLQEYELVRVLGFGGFGMTYLGFDHNLDKAVAIKEYLPSDIATRTADRSIAPQASDFRGDFQWGLERFLDEARTLARFDHRHIIKVHRFFEAHGTAYIVMEYAEGETLSVYLERKGTLSEAELKGILYPLLDGLVVVHGADFLHRDIKPGNIVLRDTDGSPVLLDFGAARQAIGAKSRSVTSIVTPGYAPIEQYSSRGHQGAWTDIYALGGVCYRALTGQVPEDATDRMRDDPLVPVSQRCAGQASGAFLSAIDAALQVDERDRPQSIVAWRAALEADTAEAQKDDATIVRRVEQDAPPSEPQKKPPFKRLAVVLGVVALLVVGGKMYVDHAEQVALEQQRQEQAALEQQRQEQVVLEQQRQEQAALEKQRQEQAALEQQRQEQAALERQRQEQAALEQQRQEQAALEKQRQEQVFVAEVGRMPHPRGMNKGETDLHIAARLNLPVLTISLLNQGADVHAKDNNGETPLHYAAWKNAFATAEVLLNQGADVHAKADDGATSLHLATVKDASGTAEVLLKGGADVHAKADDGETPLHLATVKDASGTAEVLLKGGGDANAKDNNGETPLHYAAGNNASGTAEVLLKGGGDVHAKDNKGLTPLHYAAYHNASGTAEVLLKGGADANAKDNSGFTPLHAAPLKDAFATAEVLLKGGADANAKNNSGWTPLHYAAGVNASGTAEVLLKGGADANAKDNNGETPLHYAAVQDAFATAEVLLKRGADVHAKTNDGNTPLHLAAVKDASGTAEVLLKGGAKVNAKGQSGFTPLRVAMQENASATAVLLRRYGGRF